MQSEAILLPSSQDLTRVVLKNAYVEVQCGLDHSSIYIPGRGYSCRYARGFVGIGETGLISKAHECHLCTCFWCLPALTPISEQVCNNCHGPLVITTDSSCWPDVLMVKDFFYTN